jgi:hypothetical protein
MEENKMNKITKYYVTFYMPGIICAEYWDKDIDSPDPNMVEWPKNAYAFNLYEQENIIDDNGKVFEGESKKLGPMYYHPDSKIETLSQLKKSHPNDKILINNVESNGYKNVIWTRWNNWPQMFNDKEYEILIK